jgi:hypothetical protein
MQRIFWVCIFLCATATASFARTQNNPVVQTPLAEITYRPVGKLIYVPVQVNGSSPLWFCFDTGAPHSIINTATAQKLNIKSLSVGHLRGAGHGEVQADEAGEVTLTIGGLTTHVPHPQIVDLSKVPVDAPEDGLVGAEFLEQYVVRIDPERHKLAFYNPATFVYRGGGQSIPLELTNSRLYVQLGLAVIPGKVLDRRLRVDTGSEDSVDDDTVRSSPTTQKTTLGNGLGTSYEDVSGVYDSVSIGPYTFHHVWGPAGAIPIIGMELMRRFTLTFDDLHHLLYLEPNSAFSQPIPSPD